MVSTALALGVTVVTVVAVTVVGLLAARGRVRSVEDFISLRDSAGQGTMAATIVASSMGAWILFSPAEAGATFGGLPAILGYAVGSAIPLLLFVPVGAASFPMLRGLLSVVPGLGGALPPPSLLAAFVGATFVPAVLTAAATALSDPAADLDAVDREVRRLDESVADGGRDAAGSNGGADPTATDGSRDASTTEVDGS
jgi:Na+/proline symporter